MQVLKVLNTDNGYDNVLCLATSKLAAAQYLDYETEEEFDQWVKDRCGEIIVSWETVHEEKHA